MFLYGKANENQFGRGFLVHHRILSAVTRVEFVNARISYTGPRVAGVISLF
jgi:hypothetical protein